MKCLKNPYILVLSLVFIIFGFIFLPQSSNMLIDFSREASIPFQMLQGKKLLSDIFLIYGFWGYFVNFLIYKIYPNFNLLLLEAGVLSYFVLILFYFIIKKFSDNKIAFLASLSFVFISIFSTSLFSYSLPYSFSTIWGYFSLYLILFLILYKKERFVYLVLGLLAVSKIEFFIPSVIIYLIYEFKFKNKIGQNSLYIFVFPFIFCLYLLVNKIDISAILNNFYYVKKMFYTDSLRNLYEILGVFFNKTYLIFNLKNLFLCLIPLFVSYFLFKKNCKIISLIIIILPFLFLKALVFLNLLFFINLFLFVYLFFKNKITSDEVILFLFSQILIYKTPFAVNFLNYANYGYCLGIFVLYHFLKKILENNFLKINLGIFLIYVIIFNFINLILNWKISLKTDFGTLYLSKIDYNLVLNLKKYLDTVLKPNDKLVVLPEGQLLNLIFNKNWDFYNFTYLPLDFETFGENYLINNLRNNETDYVVFYPRNTADYGKKTICYDYGVDFCNFIIDNYNRINIIDDNYKVLIFKKKGKYEE